MFRLNSQTDSCVTEDVYLQDMRYNAALDDADKEMECVFLRWSTTDAEDNGVVAGQELIERIKVNIDEWFRIEFFCPDRGVQHGMRGNYEITFAE